MTARRRARPAAALAAVLAGGAATVVAGALAPTTDEVHTLALAEQPTLGALADAHRAIGDTLPLPWYALAWLARHVVGDGPLALRLVPVLAWAVAAGVLALALAPLGRRAAVVGALVPTSCELVLLGAFARPYAVVLALVAGAVLAWAVGLEQPGRRSLPTILAVLLGLAVLLHPAAAAVLVAFGLAELVAVRASGDRRRWWVAIGVAALPLLLVLVDLGRTADRQRAIPSELSIASPVASLASLGLPFALLLVGLAVAAAIDVRRRGGAAIAPLERLGWLLLVVVPPVAVVGMGLTSGVWLHRYAAPAVLGAALVAAHRVRPVLRSSIGLALASIAVLAITLHSIRTVLDDHLSRSELDGIVASLDLGAAARAGEPIVVADPYVLELLARTDALPGDPPLLLVGQRVYASSPAGTWTEVRAEVGDRPFVLVARAADVDGLLADDPAARATEQGRAQLRTSSGTRELVALEVAPAR